MLTNNDLKKIQKLMADSLGDFFDKVLRPYVDNQFKENDEDHEEIFRKLRRNQKEHDEMFVRLGRNDKDHKRIFVRLDQIEEKVDGHEKRIKNLEKLSELS